MSRRTTSQARRGRDGGGGGGDMGWVLPVHGWAASACLRWGCLWPIYHQEILSRPSLRHRSLLAQDEVHCPAAADMLTWLAAMGQNVGVVATGFFQRVGQNWHTIEDPFLV